MTAGELFGLSYIWGSSLYFTIIYSQWILVKNLFGFQICLFLNNWRTTYQQQHTKNNLRAIVSEG